MVLGLPRRPKGKAIRIFIIRHFRRLPLWNPVDRLYFIDLGRGIHAMPVISIVGFADTLIFHFPFFIFNLNHPIILGRTASNSGAPF